MSDELAVTADGWVLTRDKLLDLAVRKVTELTAERDAALAENAKLREAVTRLSHWATQATDLLSTVKPLEEPAVVGWVMREATEAARAARALVELPR